MRLHSFIANNKITRIYIFSVALLILSYSTQSIAVQHAAPACFDGIGSVFKNCIDPTWEKAFTANSKTHWQVINLDNRRQNVLDVEFNGKKNQRFGIAAGPHSNPNTPHSWFDLSAFATGQLYFDIRIVNFSNNINGLEVNLGCGSNCKSNVLDINPTRQGQWQTISIDMQQLINNGFEISQVQTAFEIQPVTGEQQGVHIQLDNIHFKANIPAPMDLVSL